MNEKIKYILLGIGVVVLQSLLTPIISIMGWNPDLVLIFLFILVMRSELTFALFLAFFLGLFQDLFHTGLWGLTSFSNVLAVYIASAFKNFHFSTGIFFVGLTIVTLAKLLVFFVFILAGPQFSVFSLLFRMVLPNAVYTISLGIFIHVMINNLISDRMIHE